MRKRKKVLSLLLAVCLWVGLLPTSAYAVEDIPSGIVTTENENETTLTLKTKNGDAETSTFTYGDTITIEATAVAGSTYASTQELALYLGDNLITDGTMITKPTTGDGVYTITCDTMQDAIPVGEQTLTLRFAGDATMSDAEAEVTVTLVAAEPMITVDRSEAELPYQGAIDSLEKWITFIFTDVRGSVSIISPSSYEYRVSGSQDSFTPGLPENAGSYEVNAIFAASQDGYYKEGKVSLALEILRRMPNIIPNDNIFWDKNYDGEPFSVTKDMFELENVTFEELNFTWYKGYADSENLLDEAPVDSGDYVLVVSSSGSANVEALEYITPPITISPAEYIGTVNTDQNISMGIGKFAEPQFIVSETGAEVPGSLSYTYNNDTYTYDNLVKELAKMEEGETTSVSYTFTPADTVNYTTTESLNGNINLTVHDIAFYVGDAEAGSTNAFTINTEKTVYGNTMADMVTLASGLVAKTSTNDMDEDSSHFTLSVTGSPNAGNVPFQVLYNGTLGGKEYVDYIVCEGSVTVSRKTITVSSGNVTVTKVYDGTTAYGERIGNHAYEGLLEQDVYELQFTWDVTPDYTNANVGEQTEIDLVLGIMGSAADNYYLSTDGVNCSESVTLTVPCSITPRPVTLLVDKVSKTYGEEEPVLSYTVDSETPLVAGETLMGALTREEGENAGTYPFTLTEDNADYDISFSPAFFTINKAMSESTAPEAITGLTYTGTEQQLVEPGSATGGTVVYSLIENGEYSETLPAGKDADTYTAYYKVVGDSNHEDTEVKSVDVTIGKKALTITADDKHACVDEEPAFTYQVDGLVEGDVLAMEPTMTSDADLSVAGDYTITATGASAGSNYNINYVPGTLTLIAHVDADKDHACDNGCDITQGICEDKNKDHACDYGCDKVYGTCEDLNKDHSCDYGCDKVYGTCEDLNKDHACDYGCGKTYGKCEDAEKDGDHVCDHGCGKAYSECSGGTATCVAKAVCEECGNEYGDVDSTKHTGKTELRGVKAATCTVDGYSGDPHCKDCGTKLESGEVVPAIGHKDENKDHKCDTCGATLSECTDTDKDHKCDICGAEIKEEDFKLPFVDVDANNWQYKGICHVFQKEIMVGNSPAYFRPDEALTREQFVTVLYSYASKPDVAYADTFTDVADGQWYSNAVTWAADNGVTAGYDDGSFGVGRSITREEFVQMLYKYAKAKGMVTEAPTGDISSFSDAELVDSWAEEAISWAVQNGLITGKGQPDGTLLLDPDGKTTRAECATIMMQFDLKY